MTQALHNSISCHNRVLPRDTFTAAESEARFSTADIFLPLYKWITRININTNFEQVVSLKLHFVSYYYFDITACAVPSVQITFRELAVPGTNYVMPLL